MGKNNLIIISIKLNYLKATKTKRENITKLFDNNLYLYNFIIFITIMNYDLVLFYILLEIN
jgi:hypothetical protein